MKKIFVAIMLFGLMSYSQDLKPNKVYKNENREVQSFNYESLSPIFNYDDDTTYVINFWATWCLPCVKELPYFEKLNELYKDKNVKVILVSLDFPQKIESQLLPFIERKKLASTVYVLDDPDANSWIEKINKNWSGAIPATIIYKGKNKNFFEKSFTYEELEKELLLILNK